MEKIEKIIDNRIIDKSIHKTNEFLEKMIEKVIGDEAS